jgi:hypothetical protein
MHVTAKMVSLVDRMQELHQQLAAVNNPNDKIQLERDIEATDHRIDELVFELYGLTEDETKSLAGE